MQVEIEFDQCLLRYGDTLQHRRVKSPESNLLGGFLIKVRIQWSHDIRLSDGSVDANHSVKKYRAFRYLFLGWTAQTRVRRIGGMGWRKLVDLSPNDRGGSDSRRSGPVDFRL